MKYDDDEYDPAVEWREMVIALSVILAVVFVVFLASTQVKGRYDSKKKKSDYLPPIIVNGHQPVEKQP
jgi:hypothetical protein